jgi:hypothetical protein
VRDPLKTDDDYLGAYRAHLAKSSRPTQQLNENEQLRKGDWRYFSRGSGPGDKADEAAISSSGELIDKGNQPAWYAFLTQPGLSASELAERYCWLHGRAGAIAPGMRFADARVAALIETPALSEHGSTVTLRFWAVFPPDTENPFRIVLTAKKGAPLYAEVVGWQQASGEAAAAPADE